MRHATMKVAEALAAVETCERVWAWVNLGLAWREVEIAKDEARAVLGRFAAVETVPIRAEVRGTTLFLGASPR